MPHFHTPQTGQQGKYELDTASKVPGEVKRLTIPEMNWGTIQLFQGSGQLTVVSENTAVVPDEGIDPKRGSGERPIIRLYGMSAGTAKIQAKSGTKGQSDWVDQTQGLEVVVPDNPGKLYRVSLKGPHMALNSANIVDIKYKMDFPNPDAGIATNMDRQKIIDLVKDCALKAPGGKLNHLVFNCHSTGGILKIGTWFDRYTSPGLFAQIKDKVGVIWLQSCNACNGADGEALCTGIATSANCHVVSYFLAVTQWKASQLQLGKGQIDLDINSTAKVFVPNGPTQFDPQKSLIFIKRLPLVVQTFNGIETKARPK